MVQQWIQVNLSSSLDFHPCSNPDRFSNEWEAQYRDTPIKTNFNFIIPKIPASGVACAHLHFKELFLVFLQSFDFLLRKRNYRFKLWVVAGLICILCGGVMVLVGVLWREEMER